MNTRGIMLKFLLTVILAIIIFAPACILTSKFFRVSDQAKSNFQDFTDLITKQAEKAKVGDYTGFMTILDDETYVAKFDSGKPLNLLFTRKYESGPRSFDVAARFSVLAPSQCNGKDCFVLCQKFSIDYESGSVSCEEPIVKVVDENILIEPFIIVRHFFNTFDYKYKGIFVEGYAVTESSGTANRRLPISIVNNGENKDGKNVFSVLGEHVEQQYSSAPQYQQYDEGSKAYTIKTESTSFTSGQEGKIKIAVTVPSGYIINKDFPTRLELRGNQQAGINDIVFNKGFTITDSSIDFELPLKFSSPGDYGINGEISFVYYKQGISSVISSYLKNHEPIQWHVHVDSTK